MVLEIRAVYFLCQSSDVILYVGYVDDMLWNFFIWKTLLSLQHYYTVSVCNLSNYSLTVSKLLGFLYALIIVLYNIPGLKGFFELTTLHA